MPVHLAMYTVSLVLICLAPMHSGLFVGRLSDTASEKVQAEANSKKDVLALLLATHEPPAASTFSSLPPVSVRRKSALKFDVKGVPVAVEAGISGGKFTTGFEFATRGVRVAIPLSFVILELFKPHRLVEAAVKNVAGELESPLEFNAKGTPITVPVSYEFGEIYYPLLFDAKGCQFTVPLTFSLAKGITASTLTGVPTLTGKLKSALEFDIKGYSCIAPVKFAGDKVTTALETKVKGVNLFLQLSVLLGGLAKLSLNSLRPKLAGEFDSPFKFEVRGLNFTVPVRFDGDRVTSMLETNVKGARLALPLSFLLRGLAKFSLSRFVNPSHLKEVKGELHSPVKFDVKGVPITMPVSWHTGQIMFPLIFNVSDWHFTIPLSYSLVAAPSDGRTLSDFIVQDIHGRDVNLDKYKGDVVLIAPVSNPRDCAKLQRLQKSYGWKGVITMTVIAVPSSPGAAKDIVRWEKDLFHPSGLVLLKDRSSPLFEWLRAQQKRALVNLWNDKFLLDRSGEPVARFGLLGTKSYKHKITKLL